MREKQKLFFVFRAVSSVVLKMPSLWEMRRLIKRLLLFRRVLIVTVSNTAGSGRYSPQDTYCVVYASDNIESPIYRRLHEYLEERILMGHPVIMNDAGYPD